MYVVILERKHDELVDKFGDHVPDIERNCILFIASLPDGSGLASGGQWELNNNYCHLIIRSSEALTGCASFMIIFLGIRTVLYKK